MELKPIDCHCHLEQKNYNKDREQVIRESKKELKAIITCSAHPQNIDLTLDLTKKHQGFIFASIGIHPTYIDKITESDIKTTIQKIKENKGKIVALGEIGLDYFWIKDQELRKKQKSLFIKMIQLGKELDLPLIIHSRNAFEDCIKILEEQGMKDKKVLMHLFGSREFLSRVFDNNWKISIGPGIAKSKTYRKIARDAPLTSILLETDSPWFAQPGKEKGFPINVKIPAERIAEIKKLSTQQVIKQTTLNAIEFYGLNINTE